MKKFFLIILILECYLSANSQNNSKYLFNENKEINWSLFFAPEVKYTRLCGGGALYGGLKSALLYNNKYAIGISFGSFLTETVREGIDSEGNAAGLNMVMAYGGFYFDYITSFNSPVQISFPTLIGGGGIFLLEKRPPNTYGIIDEGLVEGGVYFVLEPSINLEINVSKIIRVGFGIGYRFIINSDLERYSDKDLSAPSVNLTTKFGIF